MTEAMFSAILTALCPQIISELSKACGMSEVEATESFYRSNVCELLEDQETALWHLSPLALAQMVLEETQTGVVVFPEEV